MAIVEETGYLDATAQAELVRKGEITAPELLEAAIARTEKLNPELNAVVTPMYDTARETAGGDLPDGPFKGVPFLLKDLGARFTGVPMKCGCKLMENYVPKFDSELVRRYKRAGLVTFGKTNTPEFGFAPTTESELYGPCRNPWDTEHSSGGSSGGAAAAVASGILPIAHASDGGGSIRIPASCCGIFGMKPTRARITLGPEFGDLEGGLVNNHAVTRSVRDSAALLDATDGPMPGDPYYAPPKEGPYLEEVGRDPGKLRIGFMLDAPNDREVHEDCKQAVRDAAALCAELGHEVEEARPEYDGVETGRKFAAIWASGAMQSLDAAASLQGRAPTADDVEPMSWGLYEMGKKYSGADYLRATEYIQRVGRKLASYFETYDVWLTPTMGEPPLKLGELGPETDNPLAGFFRSASYVPFTAVCNMAGVPAMSVPLHWNNDGLPIGTHFVGRFGDEARLFRLAAQLEAARPWADRRPKICA